MTSVPFRDYFYSRMHSGLDWSGLGLLVASDNVTYGLAVSGLWSYVPTREEANFQSSHGPVNAHFGIWYFMKHRLVFAAIHLF